MAEEEGTKIGWRSSTASLVLVEEGEREREREDDGVSHRHQEKRMGRWAGLGWGGWKKKLHCENKLLFTGSRTTTILLGEESKAGSGPDL